MGLFKNKSKQYDQELTNRLRDASPENTELIKSLLRQGANPNAPKKDGKSAPLIVAATMGCIPTMDVLIQHGADPNLYSGVKWHETPLLAAIWENQIETVEFLVEHGANINGTLRTGPPLAVTFITKNLEMLKCLLDHRADPNKKLLGFATPARQAEAALVCMKHDIRKSPKEGCDKCADRLLLIRILSLLRQYGGRPIVAGSSNGTGLLDAYVDLIAHVEKWEQRGEKWAEELGNMTFNDPTIRAMMEWMISGALGPIGIQTPPTSLESMFGLPDMPIGRGFERIEMKHTDHSKKYRAATESYKRGLRDWEELE
ncbi:ankyrin [Lepidopterella palustris CBS 459.81]|uniref:Ankyrin n=1 Tax=Lepidopterella palustris CBS 459.81 TaxID=1314670 RepID=A0A8E2DYK3_9PEZI|nr:ankyrin [Lepidopterella palustris CBS 459.81]